MAEGKEFICKLKNQSDDHTIVWSIEYDEDCGHSQPALYKDKSFVIAVNKCKEGSAAKVLLYVVPDGRKIAREIYRISIWNHLKERIWATENILGFARYNKEDSYPELGTWLEFGSFHLNEDALNKIVSCLEHSKECLLKVSFLPGK